jgi:GNAT superfamily N-acetyltransferase
VIRPGRPEDAERLREIEREAGRRFADVGLPEVAADEPPPAERLVAYAEAGRCWVASDPGGAPAGYVIADVVDGCAHVEQLSVLPDHQGRGLGRRLLGAVESWAAGSGLSALTLTTFADVPWSRPLYEHLGFRCLAEDELGPGLAGVRDAETAHGLDPSRRVAMRRELPSRER